MSRKSAALLPLLLLALSGAAGAQSRPADLQPLPEAAPPQIGRAHV
jgi:hypothetical protein